MTKPELIFFDTFRRLCYTPASLKSVSQTIDFENLELAPQNRRYQLVVEIHLSAIPNSKASAESDSTEALSFNHCGCQAAPTGEINGK